MYIPALDRNPDRKGRSSRAFLEVRLPPLHAAYTADSRKYYCLFYTPRCVAARHTINTSNAVFILLLHGTAVFDRAVQYGTAGCDKMRIMECYDDDGGGLPETFGNSWENQNLFVRQLQMSVFRFPLPFRGTLTLLYLV